MPPPPPWQKSPSAYNHNCILESTVFYKKIKFVATKIAKSFFISPHIFHPPTEPHALLFLAKKTWHIPAAVNFCHTFKNQILHFQDGRKLLQYAILAFKNAPGRQFLTNKKAWHISATADFCHTLISFLSLEKRG